MRSTTERVLERDRTGHRRMVERAIRLPASGPTASAAILPTGARVGDLRVEAVRDGNARVVLLDAARDARARGRPSTPTGGR